MPAESFQSRADAVAQPANGAVSERPIAPGLGLTAPCFKASVAVQVGQPARAASEGSAPLAWFGPPFDSSVARGVFQPFVGDGSEVGSLPDVRRADAR